MNNSNVFNILKVKGFIGNQNYLVLTQISLILHFNRLNVYFISVLYLNNFIFIIIYNGKIHTICGEQPQNSDEVFFLVFFDLY